MLKQRKGEQYFWRNQLDLSEFLWKRCFLIIVKVLNILKSMKVAKPKTTSSYLQNELNIFIYKQLK